MDELWAAAEDRLNNAGDSSGDGISCGDDPGPMDEDEASSEEEEDDDRPAKRLRGKQPLAHLQQSMLGAQAHSSRSGGDLGNSGEPKSASNGRGSNSIGPMPASSDNDQLDLDDEEDDDDEGDDENEVIEIFSDDDDDDDDDLLASSSPVLKRESIFRSTPSPAADLARGLAATANTSTVARGSSRNAPPLSRSHRPRWWETGPGQADDSWGIPSTSSGTDEPSSSAQWRITSNDSGAKQRPNFLSRHNHDDRVVSGPARRGYRNATNAKPRAASPAADSGSDACGEDGKMSAEELAREDPAAAWVGSAAGAATPMKLERIVALEPTSGPAGCGGDIRAIVVSSCSSSVGKTAGIVSQDIPLNMECAMCFNPIAVMALFACGHGACWECVHDWCSRGTTNTMDCPTCHVSVPRNNFRRCVVLDEVVEREVNAAGLGGAEWESRLERGQKLAREAETKRREQRDAQRSLEDTIAEQAIELERLKEEAKAARFSSRKSRRNCERGPSLMTDYGMRFMTMSNRDAWMDPVSQRDAMEELARSMRHRRADAHSPSAAANLSRGAAAGAAGTPHAAHFAGDDSRSRAMLSPGDASSMPADRSNNNEPWFSLRGYRSGRNAGTAGGLPGGGGGGGIGDGFGSRIDVPAWSHPAPSVQPGDRTGGIIKTNMNPGSEPGSWRSPYHSNHNAPGASRAYAYNTSASPASRRSADSSSPAASLRPFSHPGPRSSNHLRALFPGAARPEATGRRMTTDSGARSARHHKIRLNSNPAAESVGLPSRRSAAAAEASRARPSSIMASNAALDNRAPSSPASGGLQSMAGSSVSMRFDDAGDLVNRGPAAIGGGQGKEGASGPGQGLDDAESDLDPLDVISHHEPFGNASEWDDVLAAMSLPQQGGTEGNGLRRAGTPSMGDQ